MGEVKYVIFDKTGTITKGKPKVTDIISEINEQDFLKIAYSLEKSSEHPLAKAVNAICIPLVAGLLYKSFGLELNPMIGSLAMSLSSLFVVTNALRLRFVKMQK